MPIPREKGFRRLEMVFIAARNNVVKAEKEKVLLDSGSANRGHHFPHWDVWRQPKKQQSGAVEETMGL